MEDIARIGIELVRKERDGNGVHLRISEARKEVEKKQAQQFLGGIFANAARTAASAMETLQNMNEKGKSIHLLFIHNCKF